MRNCFSRNQRQLEPGVSPSDTNEDVIVTRIRATNVTLNLGRIPAGFYATVQHSSLEWRTENKRSSVSNDMVEWTNLIPIPPDLSSAVRLQVYAIFELQPTLGNGELLRELETTGEQLLDHSTNSLPFTFSDGNVVFPCSSILVTVSLKKHGRDATSTWRVLDSHCATAQRRGELEIVTDAGHATLSRFRRHGEKRDLERSIEQYEHALSICSADHPCRAAAESNVALAKFMLWKLNDDDNSLPITMQLYRDAFLARPIGHPDRPFTLIQLATVRVAQFQKRQDTADAEQIESLLHEAMRLSSSDSHEHQAAIALLQLFGECKARLAEASNKPSLPHGSISDITNEDSVWNIIFQLLCRFRQFDDLESLQRAISLFEEFIKSTAVGGSRHLDGLTGSGFALSHRFNRFKEPHDLDKAISRFRRAVELTADGNSGKPSRLNYLGDCLLTRFRHFGELDDLEESISAFRRAVNLTPNDHPDKTNHLNHLACSISTRFDRLGKLDDLEEVILKLGDAVDLTPQSDPDKPMYLNNLGTNFFARFERLGRLDDLEQAILRQREALDLTSESHHARPLRLSNLGNSFFTRFLHLGEPSDLERAISMQRRAVEIMPDGHPDRLACLTNLGNSFLLRSRSIWDFSDLEDAIMRFREAVDLTPDGCVVKPRRLYCLGNSLRTRFEHLGNLDDLEQAISRLREAVDLTPEDHPNKPNRLNDLGNSLLDRFKCLGELSDLEQAISKHSDAVGLTSDALSGKSRHLSSLGNSLLTRFEHFGDPNDLEQAISRHCSAVELMPDQHVDKPSCLNNLGVSHLARSKRFGELADVEQAILRFGATDLVTNNHPLKASYLNNQGNSFTVRFELLGELSDLEQAISRHRSAVELIPDCHPERPRYCSSLGSSFLSRFDRLGEPSDLEEAILWLGNAVDSVPHNHPDKPSFLINFSNAFQARYERFGDISDLDMSFSMRQNALGLIPDNHPGKPDYLTVLGISLHTRFERFGKLSDLEEALSRLRSAVDLTPKNHPHRPDCLASLGVSFLHRFYCLGEISDLEEAIFMQSNAIDLIPHGHPKKHTYLDHLGGCFLARFNCLGEISDLEEAILMQSNAIDLIPHGHPEKSTYLGHLGGCFLARFDRLGELGDLEQAISILGIVVNQIPCDHPSKPTHLTKLSIALAARFDCLGDPTDLEEAILKQGNVVNLTPDDHPDKPTRLIHIGNCLFTRFQHLKKLGDLEEAISRQKEAVDLIPADHYSLPTCLTNLGNSLLIRFEHKGEFADLEQAISRQLEAVALSSRDHVSFPARLSNLVKSLITRFEHLGSSDISDLDRAISHLRQAIDLVPQEHPDKLLYLKNLGVFFAIRFASLGEQSDLERAISLFAHVASSPVGPALTRYHASLAWIKHARDSGHHTLLHAFSLAISLLSQLAWIGNPLSHRYNELIRATDLVQDAAAAALDSGSPELAVEWLEQGRSVVWGELFQLRYARRLRQLSVSLEQASTTREKTLSSLLVPIQGAERPSKELLEQEAHEHRALAIERDKLLREIRELPGFERFLLRKEFSQLRASAHSGPVIILNATESRCDALIVLAEVEGVMNVPLPSFNLDKSTRLQTAMKSLVRDIRATLSTEREGKSISRNNFGRWESILSTLWKCVVKPVLDSLTLATLGDQLRVFWCPTGPFAFLPLHAAGLYHSQYSQPGHKVFDFVVSSYVPTLSILAPSPKVDAANSDVLRILAVRQPSSDGLSSLPGVEIELSHIKSALKMSSSTQITFVESSIGTVEEVLTLMKETDWVHFACHGVQDTSTPTASGLCLADGRRLKLSDIIASSRPRGELAFLSACHTATGDKKLSDEALHVAAGMLFAGYGSVVGTMWSISDRLAPRVAKEVYEQLFGGGTKPDPREAAGALQDAIGRLWDDGASFDEWLPFIHVGL